LTLQYDKVVFLIEPNEFTRELRRKRVTVVDYPDGRLAIRYRGLDRESPPAVSSHRRRVRTSRSPLNSC
jgi:hypothetical protein